MAKRDPRIDAYIVKSAEFARPILEHLRELIHAACPEVEETLKWGHPSFLYKGLMCGFAAFKQHCAFSLWKGSLIVDKDGSRVDDAMGHLGRITKLSDLPSKKVLTGYIKEAMRLNEEGVKAPQMQRSKEKKPVVVPEILQKALGKNTKARATFEKFSPSHQREYCEWIDEAKTDATREKRLATTLEWLAEGKSRNWKYTNC
jgi:uncharacterized protein YdeI (YjbR/CyaY-like superfamily)